MRKKIFLLFGLSIIATGLGYLFVNSYELGLCFRDLTTLTYDTSCHRFYGNIGSPLLPAATALSLVFLTLSFVPKAFTAWKESMLWFIVLAAVLFVAYPTGGGPSGFGITGFIGRPASEVYLYTSILFVVASAVSIALHLLRLTPKQVKLLSRSTTIAVLIAIAWIVFWQ